MPKKLAEMTPWERVQSRMKGLSNEQAEEIAVKILAQIVAKHVWIEKDGEEYIPALMKKICEAADEYSQEHSWELAMGSVAKGLYPSAKEVKLGPK